MKPFFIELTTQYQEIKIMVNANQIETMLPTVDGTRVFFASAGRRSYYTDVTESVSDIVNLVESSNK